MSTTLRRARLRRPFLVAVAGATLAVIAGAAAFIALRPSGPTGHFVEYPVQGAGQMPTAIATGQDGTVWFSVDLSDVIGRLRGGHIEFLPTGIKAVEPVGLAAAPDGSAWFTDNAAHSISRVAVSGEVTRIPLDTPSVRLGRLAVGGDGAVWFAEETGYSISEIRDGKLIRHYYDSLRGGPYGVAVAPDGTAWGSLQSGNQIVRFGSDGAVKAFDLPVAASVPSDVAVGQDGAVWFLEYRNNAIGRLIGDAIQEFPAGGERAAGLSGIAVAPDGAVWFGMLREGNLGRLRDGQIARFHLPRPRAKPYTVAIDRDGNVWYADITGYIGMLPSHDARQ
jgi:virginiamycin B lyase